MPYDLKLWQRGRYLHAVMSGIGSVEHFIDAWKKIAAECRKQACKRILCEGCLEGTGMAMDAEEYGRIISGIDMPVGTRIAVICDEDKAREAGCTERPVTTKIPAYPRIFFDVEEAIRWLMK